VDLEVRIREETLISALARTPTDPSALTRNEKVKGSIPLGGSTSLTRPLPWKTQVSGFFRLSTAAGSSANIRDR